MLRRTAPRQCQAQRCWPRKHRPGSREPSGPALRIARRRRRATLWRADRAVGKFIAIGLNYADHAAESNLPLPSEPIVFQKAITSLSGPNYDVVLQKGSKKSDWEVELGIVIGTQASYVERADALAHVAGYCFVNDVSEREYQMERGGTWEAPTIRPVGRTDRPVTCFRPDSSHERE